MNLEICLNALKKELKDYHFENTQVLETCEKLRFFWKPEKVKLILLAESHVFTTEEENKTLQNLEEFKELFDYENYPKEFVKLIYCLGYGENRILDNSLTKNSGTPQFWKIFYNALNEIKDSNFSPILVTNTKSYKERITNKIKILNELKENGIWLIDASIVALYGNGPKPKEYKKILDICWHNYIHSLILEENPEAILVIGSQVYKNLEENLKTLNIPFDYIYQPQARLSKEEIQQNYKKTFEYSKKYIENIPKSINIDITVIDDTNEENTETVIKSSKEEYKFNNQMYGKNRLVLAVVKKYVEENPNITFEILKSVFNKLKGSQDIVKKLDDVKDKKRFFVNDNEAINIVDEKIVVSNQWDKNNITGFISQAEKLGYQIE